MTVFPPPWMIRSGLLVFTAVVIAIGAADVAKATPSDQAMGHSSRLNHRSSANNGVIFRKDHEEKTLQNVQNQHKHTEGHAYLTNDIDSAGKESVDMATTACRDPWEVIFFTYQGRIVLGIAGSCFAFTLLLLTALCAQHFRRRRQYSAMKPIQKSDRETAFTKRKYSTTERPMHVTEEMTGGDGILY